MQLFPSTLDPWRRVSCVQEVAVIQIHFLLLPAAFPDTTTLSPQIQDDLRVYVAQPRPAVGQRRGEAAAAGLRVRPRRGLREDQGVHPHPADPLQPGGAASRNGPEDCPLPAEGERLVTSWLLLSCRLLMHYCSGVNDISAAEYKQESRWEAPYSHGFITFLIRLYRSLIVPWI